MKKFFIAAIAALGIAACSSQDTIHVSNDVPIWSNPSLDNFVTVNVRIGAGRFATGGSASGFIVADGVVMTAGHVAQYIEQGTITAVFENGASVQATEADWEYERNRIPGVGADFGLIYVDTQGLPAAKVDCDPVFLGQQVWTIGNPEFASKHLAVGIVSSLEPLSSPGIGPVPGRYFVSDLNGGPGASGSPVYDMDGDIAGVLVGGETHLMVTDVTIVKDPVSTCMFLDKYGVDYTKSDD